MGVKNINFVADMVEDDDGHDPEIPEQSCPKGVFGLGVDLAGAVVVFLKVFFEIPDVDFSTADGSAAVFVDKECDAHNRYHIIIKEYLF